VTKAEFKALNKPKMLELLQGLFDDPDDEFSDMSKAQLTQFGLNNFEVIAPPADPEPEPAPEEEAAPSVVSMSTDLYSGKPRRPVGARSTDLA